MMRLKLRAVMYPNIARDDMPYRPMTDASTIGRENVSAQSPARKKRVKLTDPNKAWGAIVDSQV
jgi:hypothetical protein